MIREYGWFAIERIRWDVVTLPDGSEERLPAGTGEARFRVYNEAQTGGPSTFARLTFRRTWQGELFLPSGREALDIEPLDWPYGYPIEEVTATLNRLAHDGWQILHVSEDRGLYRGDDTQSDAAVTKARYLLVRDAVDVI